MIAELAYLVKEGGREGITQDKLKVEGILNETVVQFMIAGWVGCCG